MLTHLQYTFAAYLNVYHVPCPGSSLRPSLYPRPVHVQLFHLPFDTSWTTQGLQILDS